jgi:hypothetical protein
MKQSISGHLQFVYPPRWLVRVLNVVKSFVSDNLHVFDHSGEISLPEASGSAPVDFIQKRIGQGLRHMIRKWWNHACHFVFVFDEMINDNKDWDYFSHCANWKPTADMINDKAIAIGIAELNHQSKLRSCRRPNKCWQFDENQIADRWLQYSFLKMRKWNLRCGSEAMRVMSNAGLCGSTNTKQCKSISLFTRHHLESDRIPCFPHFNLDINPGREQLFWDRIARSSRSFRSQSLEILQPLTHLKAVLFINRECYQIKRMCKTISRVRW